MTTQPQPYDDNAQHGVLIICRGPRLMTTLATIFAQGGDLVMTAETAVDAWECLKVGGIEAVILDLTAASLDDVSFFRQARTSTSTYDIPFLFLVRKEYPLPNFTEFGDEIVRDGWLTVPCSATKVRAKTRELIRMRAEDIEADAEEEIVDIEEPPSKGPPPIKPPAVSEQMSAKKTHHAAPKVSKKAAAQKKKEVSEADNEGPADVQPTSAPAGMFAGQLGAIEVSKILTMIEPLALTGALTVDNGKRKGTIHFDKGAVRHAELADIVGPDALFLLFHMKKGEFSFEAGPPPKENTIKESTMSLLLEGLRQMDEAKEAIQRLQARREARSKSASDNATVQ